MLIVFQRFFCYLYLPKLRGRTANAREKVARKSFIFFGPALRRNFQKCHESSDRLQYYCRIDKYWSSALSISSGSLIEVERTGLRMNLDQTREFWRFSFRTRDTANE